MDLYQSEFETVADQNGCKFFSAGSGKPGWVVYGPYAQLAPGRYLAKFVVGLGDAQSARHPTICGRVDVAVNAGERVLNEAKLYNQSLATSSVIELPFDLLEDKIVELRVMSNGRVPLNALEPSFRKIGDGQEWYKPFLPSAPKSAFVRENFEHLQALYANGCSVWEDAAGAQISFGPIRFAIASYDDIQVANEVLFHNEYNFHCEGKSIFIDIGMNAGLTSIQAAYKPEVTAVYSFEPFEAPFKSAARNFANNPLVANKIHARQVGLSDANKAMQVNVSADTTIGTSILGRDAGTPVSIEICDAAEALGNTILDTKKRGESVVVKIDCEGSEFAIMKRLEEADLLRHIDILMMEWHKWWSADMDQVTLMKPLLRAGFRVIDKTIPSNPWAGMLYAIRATP